MRFSLQITVVLQLKVCAPLGGGGDISVSSTACIDIVQLGKSREVN